MEVGVAAGGLVGVGIGFFGGAEGIIADTLGAIADALTGFGNYLVRRNTLAYEYQDNVSIAATLPDMLEARITYIPGRK